MEQPYQSDRTYPPFFSAISTQETWFDVGTRVLRIEERITFPGTNPTALSVSVDDGQYAQLMRGDSITAIHRRQAVSRPLDAWAVIADWSAAHDVRVVGREVYRDYPRVVLARRTGEGAQRLFVDEKSGYPVKLEFEEPHYLWGQRHVEYVWSNWVSSGGVAYPGAAFRLVDGELESSRTNGSCELVRREDAPSLTPPVAPAEPPLELPSFLQPLPPTASHVADNVWMISNRGYNEVVALVGNEIFLFDSTQGEARARQDDDLIHTLIPGSHKVNVVVTDLAWPHIAGLRYWVAKGATVISHRASRTFLQAVVDRQWTEAPDLLERTRTNGASRQLNFVEVNDSIDLGNGALRLISIDGVASEVALMAYLPVSRFLWASDFIQTVEEPSQYAKEVAAAVSRANIEPQRVAAEHLPITSWETVLLAQRAKPRR